jgi:hypothetical protein
MPQMLRRIACSVTAGLTAVALLAALPACSLRRWIPVFPIFEGRAIVRNAAGVEVVVTTNGDLMMDMFVLATDGDVAGEVERARSKFKRELNRRLQGGASEMFRARFGEGPWCLASEPVIQRTVQWSGDSASLAVGGYPEIELCTGPPPPPACAEPGEVPFLEVDPPSHAFGDVALGATSPWVSFHITNGAAGYVCLASMVAGGRDALEFEIDDADCRPTDPEMARQFIGPDGRPSCVVNVRFAPRRAGDREGALRISSNAQPVLQEFGLTGRGLAGSLTPPAAPLCVPRIADPSSAECFARELRLPNPGPGTVTIRHFDPTGGWQYGGCMPSLPAIVPPGSDFVCQVRACGTSAPLPGGTYVLASDGVGADPTATVLEIPVLAQVTPETCTP